MENIFIVLQSKRLDYPSIVFVRLCLVGAPQYTRTIHSQIIALRGEILTLDFLLKTIESAITAGGASIRLSSANVSSA